MNALIELFLRRLQAKEQVDAIFIGSHGKPGHGWPPLEEYDQNHSDLHGTSRACARSARRPSGMPSHACHPAYACVGLRRPAPRQSPAPVRRVGR